MMDTYFVAHTGDTSMVAGVSLTAPMFTVMIALGDIFGLSGASVVSMIGTVANMILNPLFIQGFGWGAAGSADATVIANICTDAYFVWFLLRRSRNLSIDPRLMFGNTTAAAVTAKRRLAITALMAVVLFVVLLPELRAGKSSRMDE